MEGILWKWTNYWNGWQTRWFSLEEGVLAYYKSQEEVTQGCKGSIKVIACEIIVNPVDTTRMDLVIPNEQHLYLKAASSQERQRWLVALGSAKACVDMGPGSSENNSKTYDGIPDTHSLKSKKSELRLYCDLLMQQVHMVKEAAGTNQQRPNVEKLNEATGLLTATCDTFINTLEECMEISNAKFLYESMPNTHNNVLNLPPLPAPNPPISIRKISKTVARSNSQDR